MSTVTDAIRAHHQELARTLTNHLHALEARKPDADSDALVTFLKTDLLPHAHGEERSLYPRVSDLIKAHGNPTATMSVDHEAIETYVEQIEAAADDLHAGTAAQQAGARERLTRLTLQLDAVLRLHTEKEERVYLPLIERYLSSAEQKAMLDDVHEAAEETHAPDVVETVDVRELPPAQRHTLIFRRFDALPNGTAFELVNDHDPKPLYYQLNFEHKDTLTWDYEEEGPEVWRVRIGKRA